ncbi:DJ-1/PfpI family protein [Methylocapsa palsarum]|uniref:Cyclohexyl-isocyanide hydratase n=1 Tax=Methylocapsa palsarum TaxID=1612308 RepID=A0A1I3WZQ0_9HYPH|nr:DJ-1/PfpI family protein [Methylocapsa palsarum]SFK12992.1 cyclohexyl-isocyanide hydratase [Methylocapsa palsarum]
MAVSIGILIFPDVQQLDVTGPFEVFASWPEAKVLLIWKTLDPVASTTGLRLQPTSTFETCGQIDVLCVPGGRGMNPLLVDEQVLDFLRRQAVGARYVTSVCTGALVLGAAGLLKGKRATTHWAFHDLLAAFGAVPEEGRIVRDGALMTGGGVTAGIDFALALVAELAGRAGAEEIQLALEYAPAPPFQAGSPRTAPEPVLAAVLERMAPLRAERRKLVEIAVKRLASG